MSNSPQPSPLSCSEAQQWLSQRVDGEELSAPDQARLAAHSADCETCARWYQEESARTVQLRACLRVEDGERQLEETIVMRAHGAGWDDALGGFRRGRSVWVERRSLLMMAAALVIFALAGFSLQPLWKPAEGPGIQGGLGDSLSGGVATPSETRGAHLVGTGNDASGNDVLENDVPGSDIESAPTPRGRFRIVVDDEGRPWVVDYGRSRYVYEGLPEEGEGERSPRNRVILDVERGDPRLIRLASWPYE